MRERAVPCRYASLAEVKQGRHTTFEDSAVCARCANGARADGGGGPPSTTPGPLTREQRDARNQATAEVVERLLRLHGQ